MIVTVIARESHTLLISWILGCTVETVHLGSLCTLLSKFREIIEVSTNWTNELYFFLRVMQYQDNLLLISFVLALWRHFHLKREEINVFFGQAQGEGRHVFFMLSITDSVSIT